MLLVLKLFCAEYVNVSNVWVGQLEENDKVKYSLLSMHDGGWGSQVSSAWQVLESSPVKL